MELSTCLLPEMKQTVYHGSTISTLPYKNVRLYRTISVHTFAKFVVFLFFGKEECTGQVSASQVM